MRGEYVESRCLVKYPLPVLEMNPHSPTIPKMLPGLLLLLLVVVVVVVVPPLSVPLSASDRFYELDGGAIWYRGDPMEMAYLPECLAHA